MLACMIKWQKGWARMWCLFHLAFPVFWAGFFPWRISYRGQFKLLYTYVICRRKRLTADALNCCINDFKLCYSCGVSVELLFSFLLKEIRRGGSGCKDVSLLYFQKHKNSLTKSFAYLWTIKTWLKTSGNWKSDFLFFLMPVEFDILV